MTVNRCTAHLSGKPGFQSRPKEAATHSFRSSCVKQIIFKRPTLCTELGAALDLVCLPNISGLSTGVTV